MMDKLLVLNAGSSSLKFAVYGAQNIDVLLRGNLSGLGSQPTLRVEGPLAADIDVADPSIAALNQADALDWLLRQLQGRGRADIRCAGHRVVHGGQSFLEPVVITADALAALGALTPFAPAHQPYNLRGIAAVERTWPGLPQVACFDTAFHRTQSRLSKLFPIPFSFADEGLVRYGFHGLSYEYIARALPEAAGEGAWGRVIVAHLGHGASLCAMRGLKSVATTMGLTALDGLMMGTRSGSIDPGLILYLQEERGLTAREVSDLLNKRSGLLGVSGLSDDVRTLAASDDPRAREALELFAYRIVREVGSLMAALGGLDILVFTAGIGENSSLVRRMVCDELAWAGLVLDADANARSDPCISSSGSQVAAYVIPTNEELPIALASARLLKFG